MVGMNKYFYTGVVVSAIVYTPASLIALTSGSVKAQENYSEKAPETVFVCDTESETPTMFAYTPGNVTLTPLITWHQEYLLPEQSATEVCQEVAVKLQNLSQQQSENYFVVENKPTHNLLCMVGQESENCSSPNSEPLFKVNSNYDPRCILDQREPIECIAIGKVRGGVFSIDDRPIKFTWWLF